MFFICYNEYCDFHSYCDEKEKLNFSGGQSMKLSDKKLFWMIIAAALIIGAILGCGIYFGGRAVQKQRAEQELAKQEEMEKV